MTKFKYLFVFSLLLFFTTSLFAQVDNTVKETKVKIEKQVEKVSDQANEATEIASDGMTKVKKKCNTDCKKACCSTDAKLSKTKEMKEKCDTVSKKACSSADKTGMKMSKNAHGADCACESCKMAKAEMHKDHKAHGKDCKCASCAKS